MKISDATSFAVPVGGAAAGLLASKVIPAAVKVESNYMKGGLNAALGVGALFLSHKKDGLSGDFLHYAGLGLLSMGLLEVVKNFLPLSAQAGISDIGAYPTYGYQAAMSAYPSEVAARQAALPESFGEPEFGEAVYPYESTVSY